MMAAAALRMGGLTRESREYDRILANVSRRSIDLPFANCPVSYLVAGDPSGIPVIFVHGTPGEAAMWAPYLGNVPEGFLHIAVDRPGFGESGPENAIVSLEQQALALIAVVRAACSRPAILVAHSYAGPIVSHAAMASEHHIAALVLLACSFDPCLENTHALQRAIDNWPAHLAIPRRLRNANHELLELKANLARLEQCLCDIRSPVFILHGTKDDLIPISNVDFLKERLTKSIGVEIRRLEGQGHFLPKSAHPDVIAAVTEAAAIVQQSNRSV